MNPGVNTLDFGQFASLRADARREDPEALRKAAQQFEAIMLQQMLKSMRAASLGDDVLGGEQTQFYQEMFDQQIAQHLAATKGFGVADMMVRQLRGGAATAAQGSAATAISLPLQARAAATHAGGAAADVRGVTAATPTAGAAAASGTAAADASWRPESPEAFIRDILPHAQRAAEKLGIDPQVLVAQAALETGWGQHQMRHADGRPTFNLFGIKADKSWEGGAVSRQTHEFEDGSMYRTEAQFRAYPSLAAAFDDYVGFLTSNPRYVDALRHQGDSRHFVSGLQKAGYATDPAYADKILRIADSPTLRSALDLPAGKPASARLISV
ncbi:MAG: flagellar assembly peptidoglycan hydrolase FlgJ [Nevskiales bacterium]|nr:flagellar assembly peptidoglycan hydrolase FlgJ [Nevskiales bacterium]